LRANDEIVELARTNRIPGVSEQTAEEKLMTAKNRASSGTGREMIMTQGIRQGELFEVEAVPGNADRLGQICELEMLRLEKFSGDGEPLFCAPVRIIPSHQKRKAMGWDQ
jgi:hypothetical protein